MALTWRSAFLAAAAALLWTGCSSSPPGAGLTNGEPPMLGGSEKAAERTDLPTPNLTGGSESLAAPSTESPAAPEVPPSPGAGVAPAKPAAPEGAGAPAQPKSK